MIKIYLCDLVHNYLGAETYMFPLNVAYVAAYAKKFFPKEIEVTLFKYPLDVMARVKEAPPDIVGFSYYTWNADLDKRVAEWVKSVCGRLIVVFGGPNVNPTDKGYASFFAQHDEVDFYVPFQGETPFVRLLERVLDVGPDVGAVKKSPIKGWIFKEDGVVVADMADVVRIKKPDEVPSPYLTGLLDEFFEDRLIPIVETNRGCPYTCTFCAQGLSSYNELNFFTLERVKDELSYIARKARKTNILNLADANFGVHKRDFEIAEYIARLRETTGYPRKFNTNWAKNQSKLFEMAKILKNSVVVVSLQSLDSGILKNVKRSNISLPIFQSIIQQVNESGGMSGTEIILGLPGETKETHIDTLRKLFDWNVASIICYNALVLEGSEMSMERESDELECKTKFRLIDSSFGNYDGITSFDVEEGVRWLPTMSEEEILYFRPVHWLIQFLWNYRFYYELLKYLQSVGLNPLDYILALVSVQNRNLMAPKIRDLFDEFEREAREEWFDSPEALRGYYSQPRNFEKLKEGKYGKLNGKYVFRTLLEGRREFEQYLYDTAIRYCAGSDAKAEVIGELMNFLSSRIINFETLDFDNGGGSLCDARKGIFRYDILQWQESRYKKRPEEFCVPEGIEYTFHMAEDQENSIKKLLEQYQHRERNVTLRKMSEYMDITDFFLKFDSKTNNSWEGGLESLTVFSGEVKRSGAGEGNAV